MSEYLKNIKESFKTLSGGLKLTLSNLLDARNSRKPIGVEDEQYFEADKGIFTLQYPHESFPVPDNGRYRLHNEVDDCIVCDKCAKVCPVDCIEIEPIKATETIGLTSDGTPKRIHAAKFDIDMGKCCFCGLCTTVCPTECLTMTKVYDFSEFDVKDHNYSFAEMSLVEIAAKRKEAEEAEKLKAAQKAKASENKPEATSTSAKPAFKPKMPAVKPKLVKDEGESVAAKPKPVFRPKPMVKKKEDSVQDEKQASKPKPVMKPKPIIKKKIDQIDTGEKVDETKGDKPKPKFRPRPIVKRKPKDDEDAG
ncbi:MAG: 4Fe-4S binding protein [Cyclobacteriaceae bacterium]